MIKHTFASPRLLAVIAIGVAILFGSSRIAAAQTAGNSSYFSLTTSAGFIIGGATELVFDSGYKMSELDWASQPLAYWGLEASVNFPSGWYARLGLKSGLSGKTGYMTDSDWQNWDGVKTNFSESDSYTDQALLLDFEAGYDFSLTDNLWLGPFLELSYLNFQWSARNGYIQYPSEFYPTDSGGNPIYGPYTPISPNTPTYNIYGIGIVYQQSTFYPSLGVRCTYKPLRELKLLASFAISPLVSMTETDNHVERSLVFSSTMTGGLVLEPRLILDYQLSRSMSLGLELSYIRIQGLTGDLTETDIYGNSYLDPSGAGATFDAFEAGATFSIHL
jgi:outer membrane protease